MLDTPTASPQTLHHDGETPGHALTLDGVANAIRAAGFHPQRLVGGLPAEPPLAQLAVGTWEEFCATARALGAPVVFFEAEPFAITDYPPVGDCTRVLWEVLPEATWLQRHEGDIPTVLYYAFFGQGVLAFQHDTAWWNRTEGLWERANAIGQQERQKQRDLEREAFEKEVRRVLPTDETFRRIALLPRPPITDMRRRVQELFPTRQGLIPTLNLTLHEVARQIKVEARPSKTGAAR